MKIQYMSDLHMEFAENSRYLKNQEFPAEAWRVSFYTFYNNMMHNKDIVNITKVYNSTGKHIEI